MFDPQTPKSSYAYTIYVSNTESTYHILSVGGGDMLTNSRPRSDVI